jgi:orotate phosphoribosyltransferase
MSYFNQHLRGHNLKEAVEAAQETFDRLGLEFDSVICRGNSGLLFASAFGMMAEKNILINRKRTDNSHSDNLIEGERDGVSRILIVDDFISSGDTVREIFSAVRQKFDMDKVEIVGVYLYSRNFGDRHYVANLEDREAPVRHKVPVITEGSEKLIPIEGCSSLC